MAFEEDLKEGRKIENLFVSELVRVKRNRQVSYIEFAPDRKFSSWDIKIKFRINGKKITKTYEVKYDKKSDETKNVGFEYRCNHKPSGVIGSDADVIVYYVGGKFYYQDRKELLAKLFETSYTNKIGGDFNASDLLIVGKEHLHELFKQLG